MATIHPDVFQFLSALEKNNNRDWFAEHKPAFQWAQKNVKQTVLTVFNNLKQLDDITDYKMFRIYRDVRFSKNKLPYKTHFSASFQRRKPALRGGYYIHIAPNNGSFLGVGFWDPNKADLLRIRQEFEADASEIREIINQPNFKTVWGNLEGDELKSAPRNFDKQHPDIDLIRKKQYIFTKPFTDEQVLHTDFANQVVAAFKEVQPFFNYMSDVLTTNMNGESLI
ncbi:DUF2461 domain-containing protein [Bizionia sediminis]|uniref:DUF2461 domain-containing protein n=1 Tax=Bizionia sediminis TaxID=1737064 RepID=A0ABW5KT46_9FLAO